MASNNPLKNMLLANCDMLFAILVFDGDIEQEVKFILYNDLKSISDAINGADTIDGTNFQGFRERTLKLRININNLKSSHASE